MRIKKAPIICSARQRLKATFPLHDKETLSPARQTDVPRTVSVTTGGTELIENPPVKSLLNQTGLHGSVRRDNILYSFFVIERLSEPEMFAL